jgi:hypothetical protein
MNIPHCYLQCLQRLAGPRSQWLQAVVLVSVNDKPIRYCRNPSSIILLQVLFLWPENPDLCWPEPDSFPNVDDILSGKLIKKCWHGEYANMDVKDKACQLLAGH